MGERCRGLKRLCSFWRGKLSKFGGLGRLSNVRVPMRAFRRNWGSLVARLTGLLAGGLSGRKRLLPLPVAGKQYRG